MLAVLAVLSFPATASAAACGDTISSSITLNSDLECTGSAVGLAINADGVTLDCAGHTISGNGASGVLLRGHTNIRIRNCKITGWKNGIALEGSSKVTISSNDIASNGMNGILLLHSKGNSITGNNITSNGNGIYAVEGSDGNLIKGNLIKGNNKYGIDIVSGINNYGTDNDITINPTNIQSLPISQDNMNYVEMFDNLCMDRLYTRRCCSSSGCVTCMTDYPSAADECTRNAYCAEHFLIEINPTELDFGNVFKGEGEKMVFTIKNRGSDTLSWSLTPQDNWISTNVTSGTTDSETDAIEVTVGTASLQYGPQRSVIKVTSNGGNDEIDVIVNVVDLPETSLTPQSASRTQSIDVKIERTSNGGINGKTYYKVIDYSSSCPAVGSAEYEETQDASTTVTLEGTQEQLKEYAICYYSTDSVGREKNAPRKSGKYAIDLRGARLSVIPNSLDFGDMQIGQNEQKTLSISNAGTGKLTWTASDNRQWILIQPQRGFTTTETDTVTVTVTTSGLSTGEHTGNVTVTSNGGSEEIPISVTVTGGGSGKTHKVCGSCNSGGVCKCIEMSGQGDDECSIDTDCATWKCGKWVLLHNHVTGGTDPWYGIKTHSCNQDSSFPGGWNCWINDHKFIELTLPRVDRTRKVKIKFKVKLSGDEQQHEDIWVRIKGAETSTWLDDNTLSGWTVITMPGTFTLSSSSPSIVWMTNPLYKDEMADRKDDDYNGKSVHFGYISYDCSP
ncbi:MAG: hypothetical protein GXO64_05100 [Candidatus Micrarchaeota archaeon]|nr:hypothetical protein [Candidatus Micrarchaeota archaeon]